MIHAAAPFRLTYAWPEQSVELCTALAPRLRLSRAEALAQGIDIAQVGLAVLDLFEQWYNSDAKDTQTSLELQAVLASAVASRWLAEDDAERQQVFCQMLTDVAETQSPPTAAFEAFTEAGIRRAVVSVLGGDIQAVTGIGTPRLQVKFAGGDCGSGVFSGAVTLDLFKRLLTLEDANTGTVQVFVGTELPATDAEFEDALASSLWREEEEEEDARQEGMDDTLCYTLNN